METKTYAEKMLKDYSEKKASKFDELKALDRKVKKPARIFTYTFGTIGSLVLGTGMCLAMNVIGGTTPLMIAGIAIGIVGIIMCGVNYKIYAKMVAKRKKKYGEEILTLSNELLNQN